MILTPVAKASILDGGLPRLLVVAGGSLRVALYRSGVECSGAGYARATVTAFNNATTTADGATKDSATPASFTAAGGAITFDQIRVFNRLGTTLLAASQQAAAQTIAAGATHYVTLRFEIPAALVNGPTSAGDLQAAVATAAAWRAHTAAYGNLRLPPLTTLTSQWTFPYAVGGVVAGLGHCEPIAPTHALAGPVSDVIWAGPRTGNATMLHLSGQRTQFRDFNLHGATRAQINAGNVARVPILMQMVNPVQGLGTGGFTFEGVCFSFATLGFNCSDDDEGHNCDELTFNKCFFDRMNTWAQINNNQGMSHIYRECHLRDMTTFIDVRSGGHFTLDHCEILSPMTIFKFDPQTAEIEYGGNAMSYRAVGCKIDSQAAGLRFVNMTEHNPYYTDLWFDYCHFPNDGVWNNPCFTLSGKTACHITRCKNILPGMISFNNAANAQGLPYVHVDSCRIYADAPSAVSLFTGSGKGRYKVTNCYDYNNVPIADAAGNFN